MSELDDLFGEMLSTLFKVRNPRTGQVIRFDLKSGQNKYIYFRHRGSSWQYCYTPHPDQAGWFYSWVYKPLGKGAKSGAATRWHMTKLNCHRTRKAAKARALRFYSKEVA